MTMHRLPLLLLLVAAACSRERSRDLTPAGPAIRAVLTGDLVVPLSGEPVHSPSGRTSGPTPAGPDGPKSAEVDDSSSDTAHLPDDLAEQQITRRTLRRAAAPISWPYEDVDISSPYGFRIHPTLQTVKMHRGLDFPRNLGTPVLALADGTVAKVMYDGVYGNVVFVDHEGGWQSVYAHLSEILVLPDDAVGPGALIGLTGSTGRSTGAHLHLGVIVGGKSVDPLYFIGRTWSQDHLSDGPFPALNPTEKNQAPPAGDDTYSGD